MHRSFLLVSIFAIVLSACGTDDGSRPAAAPSVPDDVATSDTTARGELRHTSWQLVRIKTPDETVLEPADPSVYTLAFEPDGNARLSIDCNQGNGTWSSESPGEIEFGPIASTRAMCPPESLHDPYLAHFDAVATYLIDDGHLFLRSGVTGAFMEFEHAAESPVAATVLGEEIRTDDAGEMQAAILRALFDQYMAEKGIRAEDTEIEGVIAGIDRARQDDRDQRQARLAEIDTALASDKIDPEERQALESERERLADFIATINSGQELSPDEAVEAAEMRRSFAREMIAHWKLNRALHEQYGGRIIGQQFGPEPLDAYRAFLEERRDAGAFEIHRPELAAGFWRYFSDDSMHDFIEAGSDAANAAFAIPPWDR